MTKKTFEAEIKVGIFVSVGVALIMVAIILLGGIEALFLKQNTYYAYFTNGQELIPGSKVVLNGIRVGVVDNVAFDSEKRMVRIAFKTGAKYSEWIRKDSYVEIATQGVLGDKYVSINGGTPETPILENEGSLQTAKSKDLTQFFSSGEQLLSSLTKIAGSVDHILSSFDRDNRSELFFASMAQASQNISKATKKLNEEMADMELKNAMASANSILKKIDNGTGTLGALVNDPDLYLDLKALFGGANRNRIMRNLILKTIKEGEEKK